MNECRGADLFCNQSGLVFAHGAFPKGQGEHLACVLQFKYVDVHQGWLIFKLPPCEMAVHPADENDLHEFYLMTDDLDLEMESLTKAGVSFEQVTQQRWGRVTRIKLPGGGTLGLYQPRHERP